MKISVMVETELKPRSVPGSDDCLGPGQSYSTVTGDIVAGAFPEEPPVLVTGPSPIFPKGGWARDVGGTVILHALICRSGRVLAAYVHSRRLEPADNHSSGHDKRLDEAALAVVLQYIYKPAMTGGRAVASWVEIPITFKR